MKTVSINHQWFLVMLGGFLSLFHFSCSYHREQATLFEKVPGDYSGIDFNNKIQPFESDSLNALEYDVMFNGGGVGIGDFNLDGLQDLFFAGNLVTSKLYLNQGNFKFNDVSMASGVTTAKWCTGVSPVDINNDGMLDIYISVANARGVARERSNLLFINQGNNENGIPVFKEMATEYGLADEGFSIQSAFFDYDKDGDLDCYVLSNAMEKTGRNQLHKKKDMGQGPSNDRLYRNAGSKNGHPFFEEVTMSAGILKEGHGLGICISDLDQDGWPDIYCANDFVSNDVVWINNQDGTFVDKSAKYFQHTSYNSMGVDIQDVNNDGLSDICVLDMLPETEQRRKMMVMKTNRDFFRIAEILGYQEEYVRNTLQLNRGKGYDGNLKFSEIGQLAAIHATDWSWAPLLADFNNDGLKDLIVTNGYRRDITNLDYVVYLNQETSSQGRTEAEARKNRISKLYALPEIKTSNYAFRNNGDLTFTNTTNSWGLEDKTYSNGAAYADFDNDGDLDLVINNIDSKASLYRNQLISSDSSRNFGNKENNHFVRFKLIDETGNNREVGAKVKVHLTSGKILYQENLAVRGYMSSVDPVLSFGLGGHTSFEIEIKWTDGKTQRIRNAAPDQLHEIRYNPGKDTYTEVITAEKNMFKLLEAQHVGLAFKHEEYSFDELKRTFTLHQQYNKMSPGIAVADVDGNGLDDVFIGADSKQARSIFLQVSPGKFEALVQGTNNMEDMGALFFDADNDGDQDLYVVSGGSVNLKQQDFLYNDRLYLNDGSGNMVRSKNLIPETRYSGSIVTAADFDRDGDLDLFRGSRVAVGEYPKTRESYLLRNDNGVFRDVTTEVSEDLRKAGMITSALWTDYNQDGWYDLILVGEFMPITFFKNKKGKLVKDMEATIANSSGWWNSIVSGDFDRDGDVDYIAGNLGLNSQYKASFEQPIRVYGSDFDSNGFIDPVITYRKDGKEVPVAVRDVMHEQMPSIINKRFGSYDAYSRATIDDIFDQEELKNATVFSAYEMRSCYIENTGNAKFILRPLPVEAQIAPVFGMQVDDFNQDGFLDVLMVGNSEAFETYTGPYNASMGTLLVGDGSGEFYYVPQQTSGLYLKHDQKALGMVHTGHENLLVVTSNNAEIQLLGSTNQVSKEYVPLNLNEASLEIEYSSGVIERMEIGFGGGYLTQSSRGVFIPKDASELRFYDFSGRNTRTFSTPDL